MGAKLVDKGMTIYMETYARSRKVKQIEKNPRIQLLFATKDYSEVVTLSGKASMDKSMAIRKRIWRENPASAEYFSGYDDPALGLIRFKPERLEYYGPSTGLDIIEIKL
jgi:general stress protein 26